MRGGGKSLRDSFWPVMVGNATDHIQTETLRGILGFWLYFSLHQDNYQEAGCSFCLGPRIRTRRPAAVPWGRCCRWDSAAWCAQADGRMDGQKGKGTSQKAAVTAHCLLYRRVLVRGLQGKSMRGMLTLHLSYTSGRIVNIYFSTRGFNWCWEACSDGAFCTQPHSELTAHPTRRGSPLLPTGFRSWWEITSRRGTRGMATHG